MKAKWISLIIIALLTACRGELTYRYFTKINADGTILKRVTAEGDSTSIYNWPFSFQKDDEWQVKYDKDIDEESGDTLFYVIAERTFISIERLNAKLNLKNDSVYFDNIKVEHNRQFMWFFTFHQYTETFLQRFPFKHLSINDYLNDEEYAYFLLGDTTCTQYMTNEEVKVFDKMGEKKFWHFLSTSLAIEFYELLNKRAIDNKRMELSADDSLFIMQVFNPSIEDMPDLKEVCKLMDEHLNVGWVSDAYCDGYFNRFDEQVENEVILLDEAQYFSEVELPGLLYKTNAHSIEGNVVSWQFKRGQFLYKDYVTSVFYRTTNYWAFIVVGVLILTLALSFLIRSKR